MALIPVEEALSRLLDGATALAPETVSLDEAMGRTLAGDLAATRTQPPFTASSMDGYAVRFDELVDQPLKVVGTAVAGKSFDGEIPLNSALRIFTGAPVPADLDTIIIQENADQEADYVTFDDPAARCGQFLRPKGMDFKEGDTLISAGRVFTSRLIALAAAMNHPTVDVVRAPRVAILATGDELVELGTSPGRDQIVASNSHGITAMARENGCVARNFGISSDNPCDLRSRLEDILAWNADVIVTIGGASVGDHDQVRPVLQSLDFQMLFWRVAMRPGKPLLFSKRGQTRIVGLPGNPVSAMICGQVFLRPLLLALQGRAPNERRTKRVLANALPANGERTHFMRGKLLENGSVEAFNNQDSAMLSVLGLADHLVVRPPKVGAASPGDMVDTLSIL